MNEPPEPIPCVATGSSSMTLISRAGFHCDVWRLAGKLSRRGRTDHFDMVFKQFREPCSFYEARAYKRDYERLRRSLRAIVPRAVFVQTEYEGKPRLVALAHTCEPWFDLANPGNEETARALLRRYRGARAELVRFVNAAFKWREANDARIIDLYGKGNLVLDRSYHVRYIDSFSVFLYPDLLTALSEPDRSLEDMIRVSTERLYYLRRLVRFTRDRPSETTIGA